MLLQGVRVVDMGFWVAGPAAAGQLSDWGADVVKIEPPRGDPMRHIFRALAGIELPSCPPFDLDNRGKRSVVLDLAKVEGRELALELGPRGIRVNAIAPAPVDTEATRGIVPEVILKGILATMPLARLGTTSDVVGACLFLLSDEASWITAQILAVDGGQIMRV